MTEKSPHTFMHMQSTGSLMGQQPEKFKQKLHSMNSDLSLSSHFVGNFKSYANDELTKALQCTTPKDYYALLQHPFYYQAINDMAFEGTQASHSTQAASVDVKMEEEQLSLRQLLSAEDNEQEPTLPCQEADEDEDSEEYEPYYDMFGSHKRKDARLGQRYQATKVPLVTDILYYEHLQELDAQNMDKCTLMWEPHRLPEREVEYYVTQMEKLWPYHLFHFQEDMALYFLHLKNYDVPLALFTACYNADQLIQLLMVVRRKKRVQGLVTNIIMKQNQKAQVTNYRVLRDRKQQEIQEELEMMINHQQNKIENEYL